MPKEGASETSGWPASVSGIMSTNEVVAVWAIHAAHQQTTSSGGDFTSRY